MAFTLATTQANGTTTAVKIVEHERGHIPKRFSYGLFIFGTVDSADIQLEASHDNVTFVNVAGGDFANTAWPIATNLEFYGNFIRVVVANGLGSESVNVVMV